MSFKFNYDVRYFIDDDNFYFRRGIWNTIDGMVPISLLDDKKKFINFLSSMQNSDADSNRKLFNSMSENDKKIINDLYKNKFILNLDKDDFQISQVLTGQKIEWNGGDKINFQLITDIDFVHNQLERLKDIYNFSFTKIDDTFISKLKEPNYLSKVDSISYEKKIRDAKLNFSLEKPVVILFQNINLILLRHLNDILENVPLFIGFIDGPFMIFLSIIPKETACWDCFEQRMLSFVKDNVLYKKFENLNFCHTGDSKIYNLHLTHLLHMSVQEVFSWNLLGMSKFMGRCMMIYLPTMEIHFQDLNKIPSCISCGYLSQISNAENNANLGRLIDEYISIND